MIEAIANSDDAVADKYLEGAEITTENCARGFDAVASRSNSFPSSAAPLSRTKVFSRCLTR